MKAAREIIMRSMFHVWDENHPDAMPEVEDSTDAPVSETEVPLLAA